MQGLSLKNVSIKAEDENGKTVYEDFGEMMERLMKEKGFSITMKEKRSSKLYFYQKK